MMILLLGCYGDMKSEVLIVKRVIGCSKEREFCRVEFTNKKRKNVVPSTVVAGDIFRHTWYQNEDGKPHMHEWTNMNLNVFSLWDNLLGGSK